MKLLKKPIEQPYAFAIRNGYEGYQGDGPGLYFQYYATAAEAEKARSYRLRKGKYAGPIEIRHEESWLAGHI